MSAKRQFRRLSNLFFSALDLAAASRAAALVISASLCASARFSTWSCWIRCQSSAACRASIRSALKKKMKSLPWPGWLRPPRIPCACSLWSAHCCAEFLLAHPLTLDELGDGVRQLARIKVARPFSLLQLLLALQISSPPWLMLA